MDVKNQEHSINIDVTVDFDPETKRILGKRKKHGLFCGVVIFFLFICMVISIVGSIFSYVFGDYFVGGLLVGAAFLCYFLLMAVAICMSSESWRIPRYL